MMNNALYFRNLSIHLKNILTTVHISNVLVSSAAKRVQLISFSWPKRSSGERDSSYCKQRGTKRSAEGAGRVPSHA